MSTPAQTKIRGYEGQIYYTIGTGTDTLFANVTDFDIDVKADEIDFTDKSTTGWKDKWTGLKEWSGTIKANAIQSGTDLTAFFNALTGATTLAGSFRPQDVTGGIAYEGNFVVTDYKHNAPMNGAQTLDLTISGRGALTLGTVTAGGS